MKLKMWFAQNDIEIKNLCLWRDDTDKQILFRQIAKNTQQT